MRNRPWLRRVVVAFLVLLAASWGLSLALGTRRTHRFLIARLEATFGRPVEVRRFSFSLLDGARLEASRISVAEDPRFGQEYFLRAERLTAGLRWRSLVRGRFEFGTLAFSHASLNLVRAADGHWNVESWLPPPAPAAGDPPAPSASYSPARLYRIEVDAGRINFKRGDDKHPFALVDVKGHLEQEGAGRWGMDLEAQPARAAVALQEPGTLRLHGHIAGTSSRLQPAELELTWQGVSLADALRLARGRDYGMRGKLAAQLSARSELRSEGAGTRWSLAGTARLDRVHRWDFPPRTGDPALNLIAEGRWRPGEGAVEFTKCVLEAPQSHASGRGRIQWASRFAPEFRFVSSGVNLTDVLAWYRAFRPGVTEDVALDGSAGLDFAVSGWPLHLDEGALTSSGARLRTSVLRGPIRVGRVAARVVRGRLEFQPTAITLPASAPAGAEAPDHRGNALLMEGTVGPRAQSRGWEFELNLAGQTDRAQDLLVAAQALGHPLNRGWSVEGPVGLHLSWRGSVYPFAATAVGMLDLQGLQLRAGYLNQPVSIAGARIELRPDERRVTLTAAQAFGARWTGSLWRRAAGSNDATPTWQFDLSADQLRAVDLDRWLGPRARPGLLQRVLPFAAASRENPKFEAAVSRLRGRGRLSAGEVLIPPFSVRRVRAEVEVAGRNITLRKAQGKFYGGTVKGWLEAQLAAEPAYHLEARFERVDLRSLAEATATLKERFGGVAWGELELAARGVGREKLLGSLEGRGTLRVGNAEWRGLDLRATPAENNLHRGTSRFAAAEAEFTLVVGKIRIQRLRLSDRAESFQAEGTVDLSRALDLQVEQVERHSSPTRKTFRITGSLEAPRQGQQAAAARGNPLLP